MLTNGQNYDIISQNYDGESTIGEIFERADDGGNSVRKHIRKTLRSLRKKAVLVIRTARSSRQDANEVDRKVNLGGIAEVVFRPMYMGTGGVFSFPARSYQNQLWVSILRK